jgi:Family of unknown function (DUF6152)
MIGKAILTCSMSLALVAPALAHHSAAAYNTQQELKVTGTITEYRFKNPHVYMTVEVKKPDGSSSLIEVEAGAASVLSPLGFTKDSVAVGDVVTIAGNPSRTSPDKSILGKDLYKKDGTYYPLNIGSRSVYAGKNEVATSIAGTWFSPRTEFNSFLGGTRNWQVTEKGKAAMSNVDPKATTQKDCIPIGAPALMFYPVANTVAVQRDRVTMKIDWMDSERTIYIDGRKHPPATETSLLGHSVGRWEGNTLVVETTNFRDRSIYRNGNPEKMRLVEKFTRTSPTTIEWSVTVDDPTTWTRPWTFSMPLTMNDAEPVYEYACHEGNYAMTNILNGSRAADKAAATQPR